MSNLPDKLEVTVKGEKTELFMSYALLNRLAGYVSKLDSDVAQLALSPDDQEIVLRILFARSHFNNAKIEDVDIDELKLSVHDGEKAIRWVEDHVLDFLSKGLERTTALAEKQKALLAAAKAAVSASTPSPGGSPA